jgi:hypothetical protein
MKTHAPKKLTFWISLILAVLGVAGKFVPLGAISDWSWILVVAAYVLLLLGVLLRGL